MPHDSKFGMALLFILCTLDVLAMKSISDLDTRKLLEIDFFEKNIPEWDDTHGKPGRSFINNILYPTCFYCYHWWYYEKLPNIALENNTRLVAIDYLLSHGFNVSYRCDNIIATFMRDIFLCGYFNSKKFLCKIKLCEIITKMIFYGCNVTNNIFVYHRYSGYEPIKSFFLAFFKEITDTPSEFLKETIGLLEVFEKNQESLEKYIDELITMISQFDKNGILDQEEKDTILKEIKKLFDTNETPMYAKQTALIDLYKLHHAYRNYQVNPIPFEDVVYCLNKILYNTRFFCDSAFTLLREFVTTNKIKDILGRSILEEAIVFCPCEYKNKRITKILCTDESLCKNRKLFRQCLAEQPRDDFMNALALAKEMKRKEDFSMLANFSFVTDALQNDDVVDASGNSADYSHLPPEVGMHILGFAGVQSFTDKMIFGKKYSKKTVN